MLLFPPDGVDMETVTAISILLAWVELLFLVGNHPLVSIYRTMFTQVSWNFFKFLLWLFWFIFGTGLAFSFLLHYEKDDKGVQKNDKFVTVWGSVFKTIVMSLTGELEAGNIDFSTDFKKFFFRSVHLLCVFGVSQSAKWSGDQRYRRDPKGMQSIFSDLEAGGNLPL